MRVKMSKQPPPAPTASAVGPCPTVIQIVGRPGTGSLPRTIAPPDHPLKSSVRLPPAVHVGRPGTGSLPSTIALPDHHEVECTTSSCGTCRNVFFRSNRLGCQHTVCSELGKSGIRLAVGDRSVTERLQ